MTPPLLTEQECELLHQVVADRDPALRVLAQDVAGGRILTAYEANALRDAIGDELAASGIDEDLGAVNGHGRRLDHLIDRIAACSALHDA